MSFIFQYPAGATTAREITFCPQFLVISGVAAIDCDVKVQTLQDGVIVDVDNAGLQAVKQPAAIGVPSANYVVLQLTNGLLGNATTIITIANNDGINPVDVFGTSEMGKGNTYTSVFRTRVFANAGQSFSNFSAMYIPAAGADDIFSVFSKSKGLNDNMKREEIRALTLYSQGLDVFAILNFDQSVTNVVYTPTADRDVYTMAFREVNQKIVTANP